MNPSELPDEALFESVLNCKTPEERAAYLDQVCAGQPELRKQLQALLQAHDASGAFLEPAATNSTVRLAFPTEEATGTVIGRYKLLQKIGEGGMGDVYMAEQTEPVVRKVALKIIKLGMDTRQVVARFEAERQALALMDHPHIAKVLDGGATDGGRPYFVMELVRGVPVTEYCDQNKLPTEERLKLFLPVCHAIQHAHQKGIIHRDIKPSNVMVTLHDGVPVPKVIDFGVAKATNQRLTEKTLFTNYAQMIGTPAYMSPEQAEMSGLDIDTRTDVYSLGVLLYELLTGTTPFDAKELLSRGYAEMQRIIAQQEPLKPSTRMSTMQHEQRTVVSENRRVEGLALARYLRGDLDWIVMKCLEKDRARRYETANGVARDIERHLNCEPVVARPPSKLYEFQKTVRRHKFGFAAAAAIFVVLAGGITLTSTQAVRAKRAEQAQSRMREQAEANEQKAETEAAKSRQVARFLRDMLKGVGPSVSAGRDTTMLKEILDRTVERLGKELANQPEVEAELCNTIGFVYWELGEHEKSIAMIRKSLTIHRRLWGNEHPSVADTLHHLTEPLLRVGRAVEAEATEREALANYVKLNGREHPTVGASLNSLGFVVTDDAKGEALLREALVINRKTLGEEHPQVGLSLSRLGVRLEKQGKLPEAELVYRNAVAIQRKALGGGPQFGLVAPQVELGWTLFYLARVQARQNRLAEAMMTYREALAMMRTVVRDDHPDPMLVTFSMTELLRERGELEAAEVLAREATGRRNAQAMNQLAWGLATSPDATQRDGPTAVRYAETAVGATHRTNAMYLDTLAAAYAEAGQFANAVRVQQEALGLLPTNRQDLRAEFESRLKRFESNMPYRERTGSE